MSLWQVIDQTRTYNLQSLTQPNLFSSLLGDEMLVSQVFLEHHVLVTDNVDGYFIRIISYEKLLNKIYSYKKVWPYQWLLRILGNMSIFWPPRSKAMGLKHSCIRDNATSIFEVVGSILCNWRKNVQENPSPMSCLFHRSISNLSYIWKHNF